MAKNSLKTQILKFESFSFVPSLFFLLPILCVYVLPFFSNISDFSPLFISQAELTLKKRHLVKKIFIALFWPRKKPTVEIEVQRAVISIQ